MQRSWVSSAAYRVVIDQLIAAREGQGVGQRELARLLGKHPSWLNKIERLERRIDLLELITILRGLGLDPAEFVARIDRDLPGDFQV